MGLQDKVLSRVGKLSGGQKQRLSLGCALVGKPKILFLDEPTTGLDPSARHNLWDIILKFKTDGGTVILTTHYMDEAEKLCDRLMIMNKGQLIAMGAPADLVKSVGSAQVKFHPVTLEDVFIDLTGRGLTDEF